MSKLVVAPTGSGLYVIKMEGGGPVPKALSGEYTSYSRGHEAIEVYQATVRDSPDIKQPKQLDTEKIKKKQKTQVEEVDNVAAGEGVAGV